MKTKKKDIQKSIIILKIQNKKNHRKETVVYIKFTVDLRSKIQKLSISQILYFVKAV